MLEFIDYEARSFDCGEYAFAQDAPCWRFGIEEFSIGIPVLATSRKSWQENKISRDILEEPDRSRKHPAVLLKHHHRMSFNLRYGYFGAPAAVCKFDPLFCRSEVYLRRYSR